MFPANKSTVQGGTLQGQSKVEHSMFPANKSTVQGFPANKRTVQGGTLHVSC